MCMFVCRMLDQVQKGYKAQLEEVKDENATLKAQLTQVCKGPGMVTSHIAPA